MEIYYQDTDITGYVIPRLCVVHVTEGERCDSLEIEFENAAGWFRWEPEEDDRILIAQDRYDTGTMSVNTVLPADGHFRILATALPCKARRRMNRSFAGKTLEEIMQSAAMASGMKYALFGVDGQTVIPYIQQKNEGSAAFLHRLLKMEGATLKCVNGKYTAIGILYAQERKAYQSIEVDPQRSGTDYLRNGSKLYSLTVRTPYATATAFDEAVSSGRLTETRDEYPAKNDIQAGRWARGLLLDNNRKCEALTIHSEFNAGFTAATRIDISSNAVLSGKWIIAEAKHDFINKTSAAKLYRCITTVK